MATVPAETAQAATDEGVLPLGSTRLIGTYEVEGDGRAIVRHASGTIETLGVGDRVGDKTIVAIKVEGLDLQKGDEITRLAPLAA